MSERLEIIPKSLLQGEFFHCRPVEEGPVIITKLVRKGTEKAVFFNVAIVCPARISCSECKVRKDDKNVDNHCLWYKGDSRGVYQIIGPGMDKKTDY